METSIDELCNLFANLTFSTTRDFITANQANIPVAHRNLPESSSISDLRHAFADLSITSPASIQPRERNSFTNSTLFPDIEEDHLFEPSLAHLPFEVILLILEATFKQPQIVPIEIYGGKKKRSEIENPEDLIRSQTKAMLRPPTHNTLAATCRLFRHMYHKLRPNLWGSHLHSRRTYHVDLENDIFHVRIHRESGSFMGWDRNGQYRLDPLFSILKGVEQMATSLSYIWQNAMQSEFDLLMYLHHLNPECKNPMLEVDGYLVKKKVLNDPKAFGMTHIAKRV
ncbi:hypothetical protein N0V88_004857 [Collariella sp. IMI 366227]|nr:hypothetical protein N0V88_004857 [Collariella sp. IMI 366227]